MKSRKMALLAVLLCTLPPVGGAFADGARLQQSSPREKATLERWRSRIERADRHIQEKEYRKAEKLAESLLDDFTTQLLGGPEAKSYYGLALVRRALARLGDGEAREAQYDWDMARAFLPELPETVEPRTSLPAESEVRQVSGEVVAPRLLTRKPTEYTAAARLAGIEGTVVVEAILDREGRITRPRVLKSLDPGLEFEALEALREWRFEPARAEQEPVPVYYVLTVHFDIQSPHRGPTPFVMPLEPLLVRPPGPQAEPNNEGAPPPG